MELVKRNIYKMERLFNNVSRQTLGKRQFKAHAVQSVKFYMYMKTELR